jgi:hypothetical protein
MCMRYVICKILYYIKKMYDSYEYKLGCKSHKKVFKINCL